MISQAEQSVLIIELDAARAFKYQAFTSAAGIPVNFKIELPEALARDKRLMQRFVGYMAMDLTKVDVIAATGGAVDIAKEVASSTGMPLVEIKKNQNRVFQTANAEGHDVLAKKPRIGFVEDVTSTRDTTEQAINQLRIRNLIDVVTVGWRRGEPAPTGMTAEDIMEYNRHFSFRHLYEVPTELSLVSVIERRIPLWLPTEEMIYARLPERVREKI
jgi:hypothetical protein